MHALKAYVRVVVYLPSLLTSALDGSVWSAALPGRFTEGEGTPSAHQPVWKL